MKPLSHVALAAITALVAVNAFAYTEISIPAAKLTPFYDKNTAAPVIKSTSWRVGSMTIGGNTVPTKELLGTADAMAALRAVVNSSGIAPYTYGGYAQVAENLSYGPQCAALVKRLMAVSTATSLWRKGRAVRANDSTLVGKVIARFSDAGLYTNTSSSHVAIVLAVSPYEVTVLDANALGGISAGTEGIIRKHSLLFTSQINSLNASQYYVVQK